MMKALVNHVLQERFLLYPAHVNVMYVVLDRKSIKIEPDVSCVNQDRSRVTMETVNSVQ